MDCPRLKHFVRLNHDGSIGKCGHMIDGQRFESINEMQNSKWMARVQKDMEGNGWVEECQRCERTEQVGMGNSVRRQSIKRHKILKHERDDYLVVGGTLDNICNSACQTCGPNLSTKIGSLEGSEYRTMDNYPRFWELPAERILELDINGGEPTASPNYKKILRNLPKNIKIVRMNTNGSRMIDELENILKKGVVAIVTLSLDGTEAVHDYVRWPIKWSKYTENVNKYIELRNRYKNLHLDFWTTVSSLNLNDFLNIQTYAAQMRIPHDWAFLHTPEVLDVRYANALTENAEHSFIGQVAIDEDNSTRLERFIKRQDLMRGISIRNYFSLAENLSNTI